MGKGIKIKFLYFVFLFGFTFCLTAEEIYSPAWALKRLLKLYGKDVSILVIEGELKGKCTDLNLEERIVAVGRSFGLYLNNFRLKDKKELDKVDQPFITKYLDEYVLVRVRNGKVWIESKKGYRCLGKQRFLDIWDGRLISLPIPNVLLTRYEGGPSGGRLIIAYSYHNEDFVLFKNFFDRIYREAQEIGQEVIYVDELGLIPKDSIQKLMASGKINEREAFLRAKRSLEDELKLIEVGIGVDDPTEFYDKIYHYLAKFKIRVEMEDLSYENWKAIVAFDELNLNQEAIDLFCHGSVDRYLDVIRQYNEGFWQYNVIIRDKIFRRQLEELARENPKALIFTLRGLGHLGMEEGLKADGFSTEVIIIAEGQFEDIFLSDQLLQVLKRNGVRVDGEEERLMYLRAFPEECLRGYFQKKLKFKVSEATVKAARLGRKLDEVQIRRLSLDISHGIAEGRLRDTEAVYEFVFWWVKKLSLVLLPYLNLN